MFVLYHLNNYYAGESEFELIAVSPHRKKLEEKKSYLIEGSRIDQRTIDEYEREKQRRYNGYKQTIRDFLNRNIDALKTHLPVGYQHSYSPEELVDIKHKDRQDTIDWLVNHYPFIFYKDHQSKIDQGFLDKVFDFNKLREYIPQIEINKIEEQFECPDVNSEYTEETLIIEEVEEL